MFTQCIEFFWIFFYSPSWGECENTYINKLCFSFLFIFWFLLIFLVSTMFSLHCKTDRKHRMEMLFTHTTVFFFIFVFSALSSVFIENIAFDHRICFWKMVLTSQWCLNTINWPNWNQCLRLGNKRKIHTSKFRKFKEKTRLIKRSLIYYTDFQVDWVQ